MRHSLQLSDWGPYTKKYIGISHIPDEAAGCRFDLSVFPGFYRRKIELPNVNWECGYHPWEASADLRYFSFRHELEWKDQVYCDISYAAVDENTRLVRSHCVNASEMPQLLVLHYLASMSFPPPGPYSSQTLRPYRAVLPEGTTWVRAMDYQDMQFARPRPTDNLTPDGLFRGEVCGDGFCGPSGLGCGFGHDAGDRVTYRVVLPAAMPAARLVLRYRLADGGPLRLGVRVAGADAGAMVLATTGKGFATADIALGDLRQGEVALGLVSEGGCALELDGLAIGRHAEATAFEPVIYQPRPQRTAGPLPRTMVLKYPDVDRHYGLAWQSPDFEVREFHDSNIDRMMRHHVHNHVNSYFGGDQLAHYTNVFFRPLVLAPRSDLTLDGLVCQGTREEVQRRLTGAPQRLAEAGAAMAAARAAIADPPANPAGEGYRFSQRLMAATTLSNVVYPVYTQRQYIKHNTPGRWWDCLYTWDSGFLGLGLLEHDITRAVDCLRAYVTDVGNPHAAFIHHGSPVPVQMFLFLELWNRTQSREILEYFYPRLRQYYLFLAGKLGSSTTAAMKSGLLKTWDYFYNSAGWDDYPPQVFVHAEKLEAGVAPASTTAMAARSARILRMAAGALGLESDLAGYDADIRGFTKALQRCAWDEEAGYFGYVRHNAAGEATGILRHDSGANFNMGLDGVEPLVGGVCTPQQEERLLAHLRSPQELFTRIGLSTVDQSAPYYRHDGYWNGAVWMPHQWFIWKTMLDLGQADFALQIARQGLEVWQSEVGATYNCFEHFMIESGRGAGWHQFTGLSSPVMSWWAAYYRPGRLTCGLDAWVLSQEFTTGNRGFRGRLCLCGASTRRPTVLLCLQPGGAYEATWNGEPVAAVELVPGTLSITLPVSAGEGELQAKRSAGL